VTGHRDLDVEIRRVLADVAERSKRYLEGIPERRVAPTRQALEGLKAFNVR
jgi:hypothetical protein